jgi:hypothetical protein
LYAQLSAPPVGDALPPPPPDEVELSPADVVPFCLLERLAARAATDVPLPPLSKPLLSPLDVPDGVTKVLLLPALPPPPPRQLSGSYSGSKSSVSISSGNHTPLPLVARDSITAARVWLLVPFAEPAMHKLPETLSIANADALPCDLVKRIPSPTMWSHQLLKMPSVDELAEPEPPPAATCRLKEAPVDAQERLVVFVLEMWDVVVRFMTRVVLA